jgi:NAD(P)H-dependent FMN reductase
VREWYAAKHGADALPPLPAPRAASELPVWRRPWRRPAARRRSRWQRAACAYAYEGGHCEAHRAHEWRAEARPRTSGEDTRTLDVAHDVSPDISGELEVAARHATRLTEPRTLVALDGSPVHGGSIELLLDAVCRGAESAGGRAVRFRCYDLDVKPCISCGPEPTAGFCIYHDDMDPIYAALRDAHAVVVGSPVYFDTVSAPLKLVMDRCNCITMLMHSGEFRPAWPRTRRAAFVVACGARHRWDLAERSVRGYFKWVGREVGGDDRLAACRRGPRQRHDATRSARAGRPPGPPPDRERPPRAGLSASLRCRWRVGPNSHKHDACARVAGRQTFPTGPRGRTLGPDVEPHSDAVSERRAPSGARHGPPLRRRGGRPQGARSRRA